MAPREKRFLFMVGTFTAIAGSFGPPGGIGDAIDFVGTGVGIATRRFCETEANSIG
jgi:hypothetical protein